METAGVVPMLPCTRPSDSGAARPTASQYLPLPHQSRCGNVGVWPGFGQDRVDGARSPVFEPEVGSLYVDQRLGASAPDDVGQAGGTSDVEEADDAEGMSICARITTKSIRVATKWETDVSRKVSFAHAYMTIRAGLFAQ